MGRAVILASGKSLAAYLGPQPGDVVIAVNAAAKYHAAEWWSVADLPGVRDIVPLGKPRLFTRADTVGNMRRFCPEALLRVGDILTWDELAAELNPPQCWYNWSAIAALVLAVHLKATEIETHGIDMVGPEGHDGQRSIAWTDIRWKRERETWATMQRWLERRCVAVRQNTLTLPAIRHTVAL